jgi:putative transposase
MGKPLDGPALQTYFRRLGIRQETQELLTDIRASPPSRTPGSHHGNEAVWYPSKKMQCIIKAESHKVEFAFLLQAEHDDSILEFWDQPPRIQLEYLDKRGHLQQPLHTADYFVFGYQECGWIECKPVQELVKQAESRPNRYVQDSDGIWHCPPGEAFAAKHGLSYRVWSSDQVNWAAQDNWLYLEDYYADLDRLVIPDEDEETLLREVSDHSAITLADLRERALPMSSDKINIAIGKHTLYVDLKTHRLTEPGRALVFRDRQTARAYQHRSGEARDLHLDAHPVVITQGSTIMWDGKPWRIHVGQNEITLMSEGCDPFSLAHSTFETLVKQGKIVGIQTETRSSITQEGRERLLRARETDIARAVFRNRVINPDQYDDDEQERQAKVRVEIPERTKRTWQRQYQEAELRYGSGFIGLLPDYHNCGGPKLAPEVRALIHQVLETHYNTVTRKPKRGAYGEYLKQSEERHLPPTTQRTFYAEVQRYKTLYERTVAREGTRAAYRFKEYVREHEKTISRHGSYAWSMAHIDHTELDLVLCDSQTGQPLGKCWLTLMILSHPRRIAAYYLTFDPPSYRSCMMVLRLCVKRYGRIPTAITVDGGPEFESVYFEQLLALYRVRKHRRPTAEPRFGSPQERLFGSLDTEIIYHLLGNTQATKQPRLNTRATDPERQAVWTLPALAEQVQQWADEEYDTMRHPALHMTPREAYDQSLKRDGERAHKLIPYDEIFRMATFPTTRKGVALVQPGIGVRMNYLDYWCEAMRDATVERTQVQVRYDPFDISTGYAYIDGIWRQCFTPYDEFAGCSERELQLLASEVRQNNRIQYGRSQVEINQKQLASFRRENGAKEAILRQQRKDQETKSALTVLEGRGTMKITSSDEAHPEDAKGSGQRQDAQPTGARTGQEKKHEKLLVFKRIRS